MSQYDGHLTHLVKRGVPPWHLWGQQQILTVGSLLQAPTGQLARISYGRPATWRFIVAMEILSADVPSVGSVVAVFKFTVGVGTFSVVVNPNTLSMAPTPGFHGFATTIPDLLGLASGSSDTVIAQDLQSEAQVSLAGGASPNVTVRVSSLFAPLDHVRPDWYKLMPEFYDGELGAR